MSKIYKYRIIFGLIFIIILYAINIQNFGTGLINPVFAKNKQTKELQLNSNFTTSPSNVQTNSMNTFDIITKKPLSSSNAETNVVKNSINYTSDNCGINPQLLISCSTPITNCGINPQAPPCCIEPTSDPSCMQIKKVDTSNFNTIPQQVHVGDQFKIQATITNNLDSPIKFVGSACGGSPLTIQIDSNVQIQNTNTCLAISFTTLNPHDAAVVQGSVGIVFTATSPGTTTAKVTFSYNTGDKQDSITKSFTFDILP